MVIGFAESALRDLERVQAWYTEQGAPEVGVRLVLGMLQRIQELDEHPDTARLVPECGQPFLRELVQAPFRVVCRCDSQWVRVVRVWRSERLPKLSAAGEAVASGA